VSLGEWQEWSELLQEMRLRAGLTVRELADRMGVTPGAIHQYYYNKRGVGGTSTVRWFMRYAEACGCRVSLTYPRSDRPQKRVIMRSGNGAGTNKD
jgi:transcriptional regulator with XRE-family HTH domain